MGQEFSAEDFKNFQGFDLDQVKSGIDKFDSQIEQFLDSMTKKLTRSQNMRASMHEQHVKYTNRRLSDGASPYVHEEASRVRPGDRDGFPVLAPGDEMRKFDGSPLAARLQGCGSKERRLRATSIPTIPELVKAKFKKLPAPSKPKFLERIITGVRRGSVKGDNGLIVDNEAASATEGETVDTEPAANAACSVVEVCESHVPESLDGETDYSEGSITPTNSSITSSPPIQPRTAWSTPNSPLRSGIVQKRCENYQRLNHALTDSPPLHRKSSCHKRKTVQSTPTSPVSESKSICGTHKDKVVGFLKNYYSISRDESFAKSVMSQGYVRALVERINNTKFSPDGDNVTTPEEEAKGVKSLREVFEEKNKAESPKPKRSENGKSKLRIPPSSDKDGSCECKRGTQDPNKSPNKSSKKCEKRSIFYVSSACSCAQDVLGENGYAQPMSPAELFDSSWSESDLSFDDFSEDSDSEDKVFSNVKKLECCDSEDGPLRDKLYRVADELLKTERAYVEKLHLLHQVFHFRIQMQNRTQNMMPPEVIKEMFANIESIFQFHNDFLLPQLEERMSNWDQNQKIGDLMKRNAPFLKLYTDYVKNFDNAMNLINTWQEKSVKFAALIQDIQQMRECGSLSLQHHMLEPIQRVPRYELLLKDYIKVLPDDSTDQADAQAALQLVTTAAQHSNEAMKKIEKFRKLLEIHQSLRGITVDFISPTRELVREGLITKISARSGEKQLRYIFLFNDMMLVCSEPLLSTFRVRAQLDVDGMQVSDGENLSIANTFCVMSLQKTLELLDHESDGSGPTWCNTIEKTIDDFRHKKKMRVNSIIDESLDAYQDTLLPDNILGKRAPRWIPDDAATMCMRCHAGFSAFRRRHHCRACGYVVCGKCCRKAQLAYEPSKSSRVCHKCYDIIVHHKDGVASSPETEDGAPKKKGVLQVKASDPAVLAGYLCMSSDKGRTWSRRWFAVHDDFVMYSFKAHEDIRAMTSMPLPGFEVESVSPTDAVDRPNTFKVHHKDKKIYYFQTDHEKHLRKWIGVLEKMVRLVLPDESQRLSSQSSISNVSSNSGSADMSEGNLAASDGTSTHSHRSESSKSSDDSGLKDSDSGIANSNENCSATITDTDNKEARHS